MDSLTELETYANELITAVKGLAGYSLSTEVSQSSASQPSSDPGAQKECHRAKACILSNIAKIKMLVSEPTGFLENLTTQMQILACLRWLGEFQILACIPLVGSVSIKDVAHLSGVPETYLDRIVRLTATSGFLHVSQPSHVSHTPLSAPFVTNPSLLDAVMFLAESAAPAALQMAAATQQFGDSHQPNETAYNMALGTTKPFHTAHKEQPKLSRQWSSYLNYAEGLHAVGSITDILTQLNWSNISHVARCVVEVGAQSTATARGLADMHPSLHFVVQITDPASTIPVNKLISPFDRELGISPRIKVTNRVLGTRQVNTDAAIYILHLPSSLSAIRAELQVHLEALRANGGIMLILTARLLPEPGSMPNPEVEAVARSRGLSLLQLANEAEIEMVELLELIGTVRDNVGKLIVTNKLRSRNSLVVALVVEHQVDVKA
ncbi:uncharacterized protein N7479_010741 [Penicillium vulpinum]|uniref:O-methyltransferase domain-containing protein n=1 Tax=Penicillium vulpinum TaxID=29845 RepID=A0A1V6S8H7_9EURO|nr:uncharacterized protein N7479_010741 [Penicillium vulpinum]KAJ5952328.1 hypothetical protein N7479_010741 [Penicillium vulpinum]OQE10176.1 hypothetical protein PENVUL_c004G08612 [Penicillium vulpinum]